MLKLILCILYVCFSVSGLTLIKLGSIHADSSNLIIPFLNVTVTRTTFWGILCYGASFCLYLGVISKFDLGIIIPILGGIINILILLVSYFILKENLTTNMVIGALIIIAGIFIMNVNRK